MIKRPKPGETDDDLLRFQKEFLAEKEKNQQAKTSVEFKKAPRVSIFTKSRQKSAKEPRSEVVTKKDDFIDEEIHDKIVGDSSRPDNRISDIVLGDIIEKQFEFPKPQPKDFTGEGAFPTVLRAPLPQSEALKRNSKSIFASSYEKLRKKENDNNPKEDIHNNETSYEPQFSGNESRSSAEIDDYLKMRFGESSVMVDEPSMASKIHEENLGILSKMKQDEILAERERLLKSLDPSLIQLLSKKRQERSRLDSQSNVVISNSEQSSNNMDVDITTSSSIPSEINPNLSENNPAFEILQQSATENWVHFDIIEKDKLEWMRDISTKVVNLKPGEKFEARFDWKGVLLPYSLDQAEDESQTDTDKTAPIKDERELYLHGEEPHRPGYTLQELFRLARSNVIQQRISAFNAVTGILNIYNQGFYDQVLDLPISKIFFLLRFGFDDNSPAMLESVSKGLAFLFYNETDEALLDFVYENPGYYWQPILQVLSDESVDGEDEEKDPTSLRNLQKQMQHLQMSESSRLNANVEESEAESRTSMSDFQLAETDLVDCLLRSNILQRIFFILNNVRPDNSCVMSCFKLLIRIARSSKDNAMKIINNEALIDCLFDNFLPVLQHIDVTQNQKTAPFYGYPQYLCLKLLRVLLSQSSSIAINLSKLGIIDKLQSYLYNTEDLQNKLIKVQIESLRILRCLLLMQIDNTLHRKFLPAFRYMLDWHLNHCVYNVGGAFLIRQHASALLAAISCRRGLTSVSSVGITFSAAGNSNNLETFSIMEHVLHDCCCNWFHNATRNGVAEFSQLTLLTCALDAIGWFVQNFGLDASQRTRSFIEKYLKEFLKSKHFVDLLQTLSTTTSTILLRNHSSFDRRNVHNALPNVGSIIMHHYGPQLIVPQNYAVPLIVGLWQLLEIVDFKNSSPQKNPLLELVIQPNIMEPLSKYLRLVFGLNDNNQRALENQRRRFMATNFFAKTELKLIYKLLCFDGLNAFFKKSELLCIAYHYVCCLTAEHIPEIEVIFERYIFNIDYLNEDKQPHSDPSETETHHNNIETMEKWCKVCLESIVYPHYIVVPPTELTLSVLYTQAPILSMDWPYFRLKLILQNYLENFKGQKSSVENSDSENSFSEREVIETTFEFVSKLQASNSTLIIVSPTEQLMYLMIAFMGPDSEFLDPGLHKLLEIQIRAFYKRCANYTFKFDEVFENKCKFENLYALFVDQFQAASYGDELFGSLVMVPLAQKYNVKWRGRIWSDYAAALHFLNCDESLLIDGLEAYLNPPEEDEVMLRAYVLALQTNVVRVNTLPYKIAKHHVEAASARKAAKA